MSVTTEDDLLPRPASPWSSSQHQTRHRWQLDRAMSLADAAKDLRELAAELTAAHTAGWWLVEPMMNGHLLAARASRRQRARRATGRPPATGMAGSPTPFWRLRVVDEPPLADEDAFDTAAAARTPVLRWTGRSLDAFSGPGLPADVLAEMTRQVAPTGLTPGRWGVAPARVGPHVDLVADGSALRVHAVQNGVLVRTHEVLTFQHAADGACTLQQAAAAYIRLAEAADARAAAGGRLISADEGFLHIDYDRLAK